MLRTFYFQKKNQKIKRVTKSFYTETRHETGFNERDNVCSFHIKIIIILKIVFYLVLVSASACELEQVNFLCKRNLPRKVKN